MSQDADSRPKMIDPTIRLDTILAMAAVGLAAWQPWDSWRSRTDERVTRIETRYDQNEKAVNESLKRIETELLKLGTKFEDYKDKRP